MAAQIRCKKCDLFLEGKYVRAMENSFHFDCFRCKDCSCPVATKYFPVKENSGEEYPLCEKDYFSRQNLLCATCGEALRGEYLQALGKKYHIEHISCSICGLVFGPSSSYYEHDEKVFCDYHFARNYASRCSGCRMPILKQCVVITKNGNEERWHVECFTIYRAWNISLNSDHYDKKENEKGVSLYPSSPPIQTTNSKDNTTTILKSINGKFSPDSFLPAENINDLDVSRKSQSDLEKKVSQIREALSVFEESAATCISNLLLCVSKSLQSDGVDEAASFILHVQILFGAIDEIERLLILHGEKCGLDHSKEPKLLCQKIVAFISLFSHPQDVKNDNYLAVTKEFLDLITSLAHLLKGLIRTALSGAFRLERQHRDSSAISNFSETLMQLSGQGKDTYLVLDDSVNFEPCKECSMPIENSCVRASGKLESFGNNVEYRLHSECLKCIICQKQIYIIGDESTITLEKNNQKAICNSCQEKKRMIGYPCKIYPVTSLEQYSYILRASLKRLIYSLGIELEGSVYVFQTRVPKVNDLVMLQEDVCLIPIMDEASPAIEDDQKAEFFNEISNRAQSNNGDFIINTDKNCFDDVSTSDENKSTNKNKCIIWLSDLSALEYSLLQHFSLQEFEKIIPWSKTEICSLLDQEKKSGVWSKLKESIMKRPKQKEGTFGVTLETLVSRTGVASSLGASPGQILIPWFIDTCVGTLLSSNLSVEGLFRKSGNIRRLNDVRELFSIDPLAAAQAVKKDTPEQNSALLKKFLRELPEPLLTFRLYNLFMESNKFKEDQERRNFLKYAICLLPRVNRDVLEVLLLLLKRISEKDSKMTPRNLAIVFMPSFLRPPIAQQIENEECINVVHWIIIWHKDFMIVPNGISHKLRDDHRLITDSIKNPGSVTLPQENMVCLVRENIQESSSAFFESVTNSYVSLDRT